MSPGKGDVTALQPSYSKDGTEFAFVSKVNGRLQVMKMASDGSGGRTNVSHAMASDTAPAWSPD